MDADARLTALAERQHGAVDRRQARSLGIDHRCMARRIRRGEWEPKGDVALVRVGSPRTWEQAVMVAVLDAGEGAMASHTTAAALWRLPGFEQGLVEVTRPGRRQSRAAAVLHRPLVVPGAHVVVNRGIPTASVALTIFQLSGLGLRRARLVSIVELVANRSPGSLRAMHDLLPVLASRGRPGIAEMRAVLDERPVGSVLPASGLERRVDELCRRAGLPPLVRQLDVGGFDWIGRVDFAIPDLGLLIEVDSVIHHLGPAAEARDAARDEALLAAGWRQVLRIPEEWVWYEPWRVEAVRAAIAELGAQTYAAGAVPAPRTAWAAG